jgi:hypothetical protein
LRSPFLTKTGFVYFFNPFKVNNLKIFAQVLKDGKASHI